MMVCLQSVEMKSICTKSEVIGSSACQQRSPGDQESKLTTSQSKVFLTTQDYFIILPYLNIEDSHPPSVLVVDSPSPNCC